MGGLQCGPAPGQLAVLGDRIVISSNGGQQVKSLATVPAGARAVPSEDRYGDWLVIGRRTIRRVTLTG